MQIRSILSCFDGISCGQIALERAGIGFDEYYASEIDKYAIKVTQHNYPDTVQLGDITKWREWDIDFSKVDLLLAGFPCQAFSFAGKQRAFDDPRGQLALVLCGIFKHIKQVNPEMKFLFENVRMKKEFSDYLNGLFGCEFICINSALVSAQNRVRYYWSNIPNIKQPEDKGIMLEDILEEDGVCVGRMVGRKINPDTGKRDDYNLDLKAEQRFEERVDHKSGTLTTVTKDNMVKIPVIKQHGELIYKPNKSQCLDANYWKGADNHGQRTGCIDVDKREVFVYEKPHGFNKGGVKKRSKFSSLRVCSKDNYFISECPESKKITGCIRIGDADIKGHDYNKKVYSPVGKSPCLMGTIGDNSGARIAVDSSYWRKLTPEECEKLQTLPVGYTSCVSSSQRYRQIGNGWTVDVIAHILKGLKNA